jgi:dephospho-CoA kinase
MSVIGITGGIASGKSTFCKALFKLRPGPFFDADKCARALIDFDPGVRDALSLYMPSAYRSDGTPDRAAIRARVFVDPKAKAKLEEILHPRIRTRWQAMASESRVNGEDFIVDIPLLFEARTTSAFDCIVTVACSPETQIQRAMQRGLSRAQVEQIMSSQWGNAKKIPASDFVIWNDGSARMLETQAAELSRRLAFPLLKNFREKVLA